MIAMALIMLTLGMMMSAFFSGSETGFYRASRTRLVLDAMEGNRLSRRILFFVNHPTVFVATALVGNNVAHYIITLAIVLLSQAVTGSSLSSEIASTIVFTPIMFVYGELLPKNLFYQAPNRLLRRVAPVFIGFAILFAPITAVLWWLGRLIEKLIGQSPTRIRLELAKEELRDLLVEGHAAGILHPAQLELSRNFFDVATLPVTHWMEPVKRVVSVDSTMTRKAALERVKELKAGFLAVRDARSDLLIGYVSAVAISIKKEAPNVQSLLQPLFEVPSSLVHGEALLLMQTSRSDMASVVNDKKRQIGIVRREALLKPLLGARLKSVLEIPN